ncbi:MAG: DUF475 domain-containing protein [Campylobacterales bacterium]|nr:DUF475 domain-containing protein [Campylobacterales bacterium]
MKYFKYSLLVTLLGLLFIGWWGYQPEGDILTAIKLIGLAAILSMMEVSLSFDNAIVNASILKTWDRYWQTIFLTVGMLIAVFGMRLLFPILIVSQTANIGWSEVWHLALHDPQLYSKHLTEHHAEVSAFGGMFLLLVSLHFFFDREKNIHWFCRVEKRIKQLGKIDAISVLISLVMLMIFVMLVNEEHKFPVLLSGVWGIIVYFGVKFLGDLMARSQSKDAQATKAIAKGGIAGFIYLEVLDASFSFDGVIGSFAITSDIVVIIVGLGIGAMFVRSMTIYLVEKGTLDSYVYLEHGAHYAIGLLAVIMLLNTKFHIPEVLTGLSGIGFILLSLYSSQKYKTRILSKS